MDHIKYAKFNLYVLYIQYMYWYFIIKTTNQKLF